MELIRIKIENFRGIKNAELFFSGNTVLVGDNNSGKSTILEAIDLVLGPERFSRHPVVDEHDFYAGEYLTAKNELKYIDIEVVISGLSEEQQVHFANHLEWWDCINRRIIDSPPAAQTDSESVVAALRVAFRGYYDENEDDFTGETFFKSPKLEDPQKINFFGKNDKRKCGFLYLRTLRTGSRALSLEHGSLLDIILRLKELRPKMWEDIIQELSGISVANNSALGIIDILKSVRNSIRNIVPQEYCDAPQIRVSQMTREHLRQILTVFIDTGSNKDNGEHYAAPFHHQGTGTINTLVLALLSIIAELKQNVIFAMEEPEIALPPLTQKRIINSVKSKSAQAIFTSHSPYVLEEFDPNRIIVIDRKNGLLIGIPATYPHSIKTKIYRQETRRRCEALLARRVLIVEGKTEYDSISALSNYLPQLNSTKYSELDAMGIAIIDAQTDSQIRVLAEYFRGFGKKVYAIFDKQNSKESESINAVLDKAFESTEKGFEKLVTKNSNTNAIRRFAMSVVEGGKWPAHLNNITPTIGMPDDQLKTSMQEYFKANKGEGTIADFLIQCSEAEMPEYLLSIFSDLKEYINAEEFTNSAEDNIVEELLGETDEDSD